MECLSSDAPPASLSPAHLPWTRSRPRIGHPRRSPRRGRGRHDHHRHRPADGLHRPVWFPRGVISAVPHRSAMSPLLRKVVRKMSNRLAFLLPAVQLDVSFPTRLRPDVPKDFALKDHTVPEASLVWQARKRGVGWLETDPKKVMALSCTCGWPPQEPESVHALHSSHFLSLAVETFLGDQDGEVPSRPRPPFWHMPAITFQDCARCANGHGCPASLKI